MWARTLTPSSTSRCVKIAAMAWPRGSASADCKADDGWFPVHVWPPGDVTSGVCRTEPLVQMSFVCGSASPTSACSSGAHARARRPLLGTRYGATWPRTSRYAGVHPAGPLSPAGGNFSRNGCTQEALGDAADDSKAPVYDESWRASWNLLQQRQIMREREDGRRFLCGVHCTQQRRRGRRNPELLNISLTRV